MERKRIAVLFGGASSEYEVSLQSAYAVMTHIDTKKYEVLPIGIAKNGAWYLYRGELSDIPGDNWFVKNKCVPVAVSPDKSLHGILLLKEDGAEEISLDGALPILHGKNGEDGTVQGVLELADIPVIGCNTMSAAVCVDKETAHRLARACGVKTAQSYMVSEDDKQNSEQIEAYGEMLRYPLFVKPLRAGSSFGITKVSGREELHAAVEHAFAYDSEVILEEMIEGFEVGCAILGTNKLIVGEVDEIELSEGFFDYTEKYTLKSSQIHVPARISEEKAREIKDAALRIYRGLGIIGEDYPDLNWMQQKMTTLTNLEHKTGTLADALKGADIFVGVSAPGIVTAEMVSSMNKDAILFAMANPVPEIMPDAAKAAGARIVGTGRSDFPNQVNNVVAFPGIFKGALEGRAPQITEEMKLAAAKAIAELVPEDQLNENFIMPEAFDPRVAQAVSTAVKSHIPG